VERLAALTPHLIVLEATGGYERAVVAALAAAQLPVVVANPRQLQAGALAALIQQYGGDDAAASAASRLDSFMHWLGIKPALCGAAPAPPARRDRPS
jgi:shikimate 5-dehydrogenase